MKAKVEEYARQKGEEKEILKAADEALAKEEIKRRRAANRQLERFQLRVNALILFSSVGGWSRTSLLLRRKK